MAYKKTEFSAAALAFTVISSAALSGCGGDSAAEAAAAVSQGASRTLSPPPSSAISCSLLAAASKPLRLGGLKIAYSFGTQAGISPRQRCQQMDRCDLQAHEVDLRP
jgi:hypothetical protein